MCYVTVYQCHFRKLFNKPINALKQDHLKAIQLAGFEGVFYYYFFFIKKTLLNSKQKLPRSSNVQPGLKHNVLGFCRAVTFHTLSSAANTTKEKCFISVIFFFLLSNWAYLWPGWRGRWASPHGNRVLYYHDNWVGGVKKRQQRWGEWNRQLMYLIKFKCHVLTVSFF